MLFISCTATPDHGPVITGGKARYQIGDMVRLNCTSGRSKPAAHLQWFINGEPAEPSLLRQFETLVTGREGNQVERLDLFYIDFIFMDKRIYNDIYVRSLTFMCCFFFVNFIFTLYEKKA